MSFSLVPSYPISSPSDSAYFWFEQSKDYYESSLVLLYSESRHKYLPIITLQAFSVECALKSLLALESLNVPHGHNLFKLFNTLPKHLKKEISDLCSSTHDLSVSDVLKAVSNDFIESRYSFEQLNQSFVQKGFSSGWLQAVNALLVDYIEPKIQPLW